MKILKECCITAMDKFFEKKNVTEGLEELKKMGLVTQVTESFQDMLITRNQSKGELEIEFKATADGIIYTKKMLKPILSLVENGGIEKIAQKLDPKTNSWTSKLIDRAKDLTQQEIVQEIAKFGLGNIEGLSKLLEGIRSL